MEAEEPFTFSSYFDITKKLKNGELLLCDKPRRGKIWRIFSRILNREGEELDFVWCRNCEKVCRFKSTQSSNLCRHSCFNELNANAENEFSILVDEKPKIQLGDVSVNNLTQLITKWIIQSCYPYDLVQSEQLKDIFKELLSLGAKFGNGVDLSKLLPSLPKISKNISSAYKYFFDLVKVDIASVKENGFGLAADIWTDNLTEESYISLTVHYCQRGVLTYRLLGFQLLDADLIANQNIGETIQSILEKFDCQLSNQCIIVTNGTTDTSKTLPDVQNLPCMRDLLNNILLKSMEKVPQVLEIINSCSKLMNLLKKKAPHILLTKLSYKRHHNRCRTVYQMLDSILNNWDEIEQFLKDNNEMQNFAISKNKLQAVERVLQPFEEAMETLEDDSYATLHLVMACMHELRKICQTNVDECNDFSFVESLQEKIRLNLEDAVVKHISIVHKIAVFLYPPTNKLLPYSDAEKRSIEDECVRLLKHYKIESKPVIKQEPGEQKPHTSACKRRKLLADFLESETQCDTNEIIKQELQNYKNTRVLLSDDFNVFNWWDMQKDNFPLLYKLSCTVLATPATNAASKRVFSKAKCLLLSEKIGQDSTETDIESIMFINTNAPRGQLDQYFAV